MTNRERVAGKGYLRPQHGHENYNSSKTQFAGNFNHKLPYPFPKDKLVQCVKLLFTLSSVLPIASQIVITDHYDQIEILHFNSKATHTVNWNPSGQHLVQPRNGSRCSTLQPLSIECKHDGLIHEGFPSRETLSADGHGGDKVLYLLHPHTVQISCHTGADTEQGETVVVFILSYVDTGNDLEN